MKVNRKLFWVTVFISMFGQTSFAADIQLTQAWFNANNVVPNDANTYYISTFVALIQPLIIAGTLEIRKNGGALDDNSITISNLGTLTIKRGSIFEAGGGITVRGPLSNSNIVTVESDPFNPGDVFVNAGSFTNGKTLNVNGIVRLNNSGTLKNQGLNATINVGSTGEIRVAGSSKLQNPAASNIINNGGTINITSSDFENNGTVNNNEIVNINSGGELKSGSGTFNNNDTTNVAASGKITLDGTGKLNNNSTLNISGLLQTNGLGSEEIKINSGTLNVEAGGMVKLDSSGTTAFSLQTFGSSTLTIKNNGELNIPSGSASKTKFAGTTTVEAGGDFECNGTTRPINTGTMTIKGGVIMNNSSASTTAFDNNGTINIDGSVANCALDKGLVNGASGTPGILNLKQGTLQIFSKINNGSGTKGTVNISGGTANVSGTLNNGSGATGEVKITGGTTNVTGAFNNGGPSTGDTEMSSGRLNLKSTGTLTNAANGTLTISGGTLDIENGTTLTAGGTRSIFGSTASIASGVTTIPSAMVIPPGSTIINGSGAVMNNNLSVTNGGTVTNNGTYNTNSSTTNNGTMTNDGTTNNNGTFTNSSSGTIHNNSTIDNKSSGTFNNAGTLNNNSSATLVNSGDVNNTGSLNNKSGATINNNDDLNNNAGGTLTNESGGTINNNDDAQITNNETFTNSSTLQNDGQVNNRKNMTNNSPIINNIAFNNYDSFTNDGIFINHGGISNHGTFTNDDDGDLTNNGNFFKLFNSSFVEVGGSSFTNNGTIYDWTDNLIVIPEDETVTITDELDITIYEPQKFIAEGGIKNDADETLNIFGTLYTYSFIENGDGSTAGTINIHLPGALYLMGARLENKNAGSEINVNNGGNLYNYYGDVDASMGSLNLKKGGKFHNARGTKPAGIIPSAGSTFLDGEEINLDRDLDVDFTWTITGEKVINGYGHHITFGSDGRIVIWGDGAALLLDDVIVDGVETGKVRCLDNTATLSLHNAILNLDENFTFSWGKLNVAGECLVDSDNKMFIYESDQNFVIERASTLHMLLTTLKYDTASSGLLMMTDKTSNLHLENATLRAQQSCKLEDGTLMVTGLGTLQGIGELNVGSLDGIDIFGSMRRIGNVVV